MIMQDDGTLVKSPTGRRSLELTIPPKVDGSTSSIGTTSLTSPRLGGGGGPVLNSPRSKFAPP